MCFDCKRKAVRAIATPILDAPDTSDASASARTIARALLALVADGVEHDEREGKTKNTVADTLRDERDEHIADALEHMEILGHALALVRQSLIVVAVERDILQVDAAMKRDSADDEFRPVEAADHAELRAKALAEMKRQIGDGDNTAYELDAVQALLRDVFGDNNGGRDTASPDVS